MASGDHRDGHARLRRRAVAARILIAAYMLVTALLLMAGGTTLLTAPYVDQQVFIGLLGLWFSAGNILLALAGIAVLLWVHRAHAGMHEAGLRHLRYGPGWSVASFFVPLANLVVPFRAMRELWNRSHGEDEYQAAGSVPDVGAWWSCFVAGNVVAWILTTLVVIDLATPFVIMTPPTANLGLILFAMLLLIGAALYLFRIIGAITRAQASLANFGDVFG